VTADGRGLGKEEDSRSNHGNGVHLAEEVASWVDSSSQAHDDAHVVERLLDGIGALPGRPSRLTTEDREEDESPAAHTEEETNAVIAPLPPA